MRAGRNGNAGGSSRIGRQRSPCRTAPTMRDACSHTAAQVWHAQAIDMMVAGINRPVVAELLGEQGVVAPLRLPGSTRRTAEQIAPSQGTRS